MPRTYERVNTRPKPTEDALKKAIVEVHTKQCTIRGAAEKYNLSKSTLGFYCLRNPLKSIENHPIKKPHHHSQILSVQQEQELSDYLKYSCILNHGLTPKETRQLAYKFADANALKFPPSWIVNKEASRDWFTAFLKRNPTLSIRKPEATSQARAAGFNRIVVVQFYDNLLYLINKYKFLPWQI
jgi:helix-turn-helix, Psq domain